ncbi:MAG TPA: hypothetical protein VM656_01085 [Pyrinomonadaceae bacterium]|nr:hypothetical protein [Pyrinomonadaceae bacterium]
MTVAGAKVENINHLYFLTKRDRPGMVAASRWARQASGPTRGLAPTRRKGREMTRNLKVLGLALMTAFAMSAVAASAASAQAFHFASEAEHTILTGKQEGSDVFTTHAGTVTCTTAKYTGTIQSATKTTTVAEVTPEYSGCTAFGFANVPIHHNECKYKFVAGTKESGNYEGSIDIVCPTGKKIEITAPGCLVTVGPQTGLKKVTFHNVGASATREITATVNLTGIKYEEHAPTFFSTCEYDTVATNNGTYTGNAIVTGEDTEGKHVGLFLTP